MEIAQDTYQSVIMRSLSVSNAPSTVIAVDFHLLASVQMENVFLKVALLMRIAMFPPQPIVKIAFADLAKR